MNSRKWLNDVMKSDRKKGLPILSFPCVELMGITVQEMINDSSLMAKGMKVVADNVDSAAAVSMMDLSVEAEAFGSSVRCFKNEVPAVTDEIVKDEASLRVLRTPHVGDGRTELFIKSVEEACKLITDRPVFAGAAGPFSLAGRLLGVSEIMLLCLEEPELVAGTMRKVTDFLIEYTKAFKDTGAAGLIMAEPLTGLLSPSLAEEFSEPYVKEIIDAAQDDDYLIIYHNCGGTVPQILDSILRVGAAGYHFGNAINMKEMLERMPSDVAVMGNIDPSTRFCMHTPEDMRKSVLDLMSECCPAHPNFIISSGCDIAANAKWDNIRAFFSAVDEYYSKA